MSQTCYTKNCTNRAVSESLKKHSFFGNLLLNDMYQVDFCVSCSDKYEELAQGIRYHPTLSFPTGFILISMVLTTIMNGIVPHIISDSLLKLIIIIFLPCFIGLLFMSNRWRKQRVIDITREHPSFDKFHKEWKRRNERK